ncbi:MAG: ComEC family competence protein [Candidatus Yonathbacteria bacterium]|nr:ComEC family competence protein [Candidatus Yonathbacteria bacterium]
MRAEYFFGFIVSFIVGVFLESVLDFGYAFAVLCALLSVFVFAAEAKLCSKNVLLVSFVLLGISFGIFRVGVSNVDTQIRAPDFLVGKVAEVKGTVMDEPDVRESYTNVVLETRSVLKEKSLVLVRVPAYPELKYGDFVEVVGKIMKTKNFSAKDNARAFDYSAYLAKDDIYYQMYFPKVSVIANNKGNIIKEKLFDLKAWLMKNISRMIPEPESSLAGGITLGAKQSLGEGLIQKFRDTGVAHIVVLSGYNIAVVAGIISRLIAFMPFSIRLIMSALGIVLFAVMVGGGATVVRATAMALVVILARVLGRDGDALRVLVLVGGFMVFANPMILLHDVSFQLSFLATLAIVVFAPVIEKYFVFISSRIFREIVVTTFATQIFVLPLILYNMGSVSLIGFVANIFILPVVPLAMLLVALVAIFAWLPIIGSVLAFSSYILLAYIFIAVDFFARVPFASLKDISFPLLSLILLYTLLGVIIFRFHSRLRDY